MQAILVRYLGPTNSRGSRLKASCDRGSVTVPYNYGLSHDSREEAAARMLVEKFLAEDQKLYGTMPEDNPWNRPMLHGGLPGNGGEVFVFTEKGNQ